MTSRISPAESGERRPSAAAERMARWQCRSRSGVTPSKARAPSKIEAPSQVACDQTFISGGSPMTHFPSIKCQALMAPMVSSPVFGKEA